MPVEYTTSIEHIGPESLRGFFDGWPNPPSPEVHLRILRGSSHVVLAVEPGDRVIGFVNGISDGFYCAYIPLLEVLPGHRGRGIGTELVRRILAALDGFYGVDLTCDPAIQPFYERLGLTATVAMVRRNLDRQPSGAYSTRS